MGAALVTLWVERFVDRVPKTVNARLGVSSVGALRGAQGVTKDWRRWAKGEAEDRGWPPFAVPVSITVVHLRKDATSMPDVGAAFFLAKAMIDGLVDAGVLTDDRPEYVRSLHFTVPEVVGRHGVRLIIRELEQHLPSTDPAGLPTGDIT